MSEYLAHHGIKGQQWGKRRFQNEDGSLTEEGRARYLKQISKLANNVYRNASHQEPQITRDVVSAINKSGAKTYGLDHRLKTVESISRKIDADSKEKGIYPYDAAKRIKDSVRYTSLSSDSDFTENYKRVKSSLARKGYKEVRCRNYFDLYNKGEAKHKQITSVFSDRQGNSFEVQFHTESSIKAKEKKTPLYEEARKTDTSEKRKKELSNLMDILAKDVKTPKGALDIKSHDSDYIGPTQKQTERQAEQVKTIMKAAAGITVAAALAYGGYKAYSRLSPLFNRSIRPGKEIHRVSSDVTESLSRPFFASDNKRDFVKYRGALGKERLEALKQKNSAFVTTPLKGGIRQGPPLKEAVYDIAGKTSDRIKIAGDRAGKKAFDSLMKNDPEFRRAIELKNMSSRPIPVNMKGNPDSSINQYKLFNRELAIHTKGQQSLNEKFYNELRKKGFGGVVDINDREFSSYASKAKIIFDTDKVMKTGISEINDANVSKYKEQAAKVFTRQVNRRKSAASLIKGMKRVLFGSAAVAGLSKGTLMTQQAEDRSLIQKYKKDHPNTKLSDKQILKSIRG